MAEPTPSIIELALQHGASSYRNRADTNNPAYGFTEEGLRRFADALLASAPPAVAAQAPAAVSVSATKLASLVKELRMLAAVQESEYPNFQIILEEAAKALESATPALPTTGQVLAITTAYEQGVGKGHDAHNRSVEIKNPYGKSYRCDEAWRLGYEEGKKQAVRKAEVQAEPVAVLKGAPYQPTSAMLIAAREIDPALPVDAIRAIWWAMWRTAPQAQPADALDAARWRALLACGRIRLFGTAGVNGSGIHDPSRLDTYNQPYGNYVHFVAEFWSTFPDQHYYNTKENPVYARATLTEFADACRAAMAAAQEGGKA